MSDDAPAGETPIARLVRLREAMARAVGPTDGPHGLLSPAADRWNAFLVEQYEPPPGKPILALWQCSIRRPFSSSPSHASLRLAVRLATGLDPAAEPTGGPVHPVVLASTLGPVPYELERLWPANVRALGVNQMSDEQYAEDRILLTDRLADYLSAHRHAYQHIVTFTTGRYGEIAARAAAAAGVQPTFLPRGDGAEVLRWRGSRPRKYWERWWIQLTQAVIARLPEEQREQAAERVAGAEVEIQPGAAAGEWLSWL